MSSPITFSFAIVNWNTSNLLRDCLDSIQIAAQGFSHEIMVADNGSSDDSVSMVQQLFPEVRLIENSKNRGFANAHQQLFDISQGLFHVLVNSDVRMHPDTLPVIHQRLQRDLRIGVLGCRIMGPDGNIQPSCRRFPTLSRQFVQALGLHRAFADIPALTGTHMNDFDHLESRPVDQVMGSLFVMRRQTCEEIGFLDTRFFMYYEEVDFCRRCIQHGWKVFYEADASVWHQGGGSSQMVKVLTIRRTMRSMRLYFKKHVGWWTWFPLLAIVSLDTVTHTLHAIATGRSAPQVLKAYCLATWDVLRCRTAGL